MIIEENTIIYPLPSSKLLEEMEEYWELVLPNDYKDLLSESMEGGKI